MKILRTDAELDCPVIDRTLRERGHELVLLPDGVTEARLAAEACDADLILMCYTPVTRAVIDSANRLRGIVKYGVGIDAIDIPAARARGIPVVNIPDYAVSTVAEGAFAMMIALAKRLPEIGAEMAARGWIWPQSPWLASDLAGKTLGIVGCGSIGQSMARMAGAGFLMRVVGYDPHQLADTLVAAGIEPCADLGAMLEQCDFLSVHAVLREGTRHLIDAAALARLPSHAVLINSARGALVDEAALVAALTAGRLGGAGLDVYSNEPLARTGHPMSPLFEMPNVILHPHMTFFTAESMARLEADTLERCFECLDSRPVTIKSADPRLLDQAQGVYPPGG